MDYPKQYLLIREDLNMPAGKIAAMAGHLAMSFLCYQLDAVAQDDLGNVDAHIWLTDVEWQWLTQRENGNPHQIAFTKLCLAVPDEESLYHYQRLAKDQNLSVYPLVDSGHTVNAPGTFVGIAIGPCWKWDAPFLSSLPLYGGDNYVRDN